MSDCNNQTLKFALLCLSDHSFLTSFWVRFLSWVVLQRIEVNLIFHQHTQATYGVLFSDVAEPKAGFPSEITLQSHRPLFDVWFSKLVESAVASPRCLLG